MQPLLPTADALMETFRRAADESIANCTNPDGTPVRLNWRPRSLVNVVRLASVRLALRVLSVVDDRFRASFLDTAEGADLDRWAASEAPGYPRKPAGAATTRLLLIRGADEPLETIRAGSRFATTATSTAPAVSFVSTEDVTVSANATLALVDVECEAAGPAGNVEAGAVNRALSPLASSWTVSSTSDAAGGDPEESDEDFRDRLRQRDARYRRGTVQALRLGALSIPGVSRVVVRDPQWHRDVPDGQVHVIVGDARGIGSPPMVARVKAAMAEWASGGAKVQVFPIAPRSVIDSSAGLPDGTTALLLAVTMRRGTYNLPALEAELRANLRAISARLEPGAPLHRSQITAAAHALGPFVRGAALASYPSEIAITDDWPGAPTITTAERWDAPDAAWRIAFDATE